MPIYSAYIPKHNLVISVLQATIYPDDLREFVRRFTNNKEYQQASNFLLDTQLAKINSLAEIQPLIQCCGSVPQPVRIVVVSNHHSEQIAHLERDYQDANFSLIVFNALHPACTILGLDLIETNQTIRRMLKKV